MYFMLKIKDVLAVLDCRILSPGNRPLDPVSLIKLSSIQQKNSSDLDKYPACTIDEYRCLSLFILNDLDVNI